MFTFSLSLCLMVKKLQNWLLSAWVTGGIGNNLFAHVSHKCIPVSLPDGKIFLGKFQIHRISVDHTQEWNGDDEGFEHNVVDYLLKPIIFSRFYKAAQRAQEIISAPGKETDDYILVKTEYKGKLLRIKINDIIYIEGMGKYVRFHIRNADPVTALLTIAGLEEKLSRDRFVRIHKSFIIAIPFLSMINGNTVYLEHTKENLPIGQAYRDVFMGHMREKVITNTPGHPSTE